MKLHARFLNEGATLVIEGSDCRLAVETTCENMVDCEAIARVINSFGIQRGEPNTRVAGMVRDVGPWRSAEEDGLEESS
jgi:hypothetical protein